MERKLLINPSFVRIDLPKEVLEIFEVIKRYGADAYVVGGCVRDSILGREVHDWDICTPALACELEVEFTKHGYRVIETGLQHGTITVMVNGKGYEITTFRRDGNYSDGRHPDSVEFTSDLEVDLSRRDFTINAMAYNLDDGIIDPFSGLLDLQDGVIRCVGNPYDRFNEDALRILRALRFSVVLNFDIEEVTSDAIMDTFHKLNWISVERLNNEFCKIITSTSLKLMDILHDYRSVFAVLLPEIKQSFGCIQNSNEMFVYQHSIQVLREYNHLHSFINEPVDLIVSLAAYFHDIGKPYAKMNQNGVQEHLPKHSVIGAKMVDTRMRAMRFDNETREAVVELVAYHNNIIGTEPRHVKRLLNKIGEKQFRRLLRLKRANAQAQRIEFLQVRDAELDIVEAILNQVIEEQQCFTLKDLKINGNDLINIGFKPGKEIGKTLNQLLEFVISDKVENDREYLLSIAENLYVTNRIKSAKEIEKR